MKYLDRVTFFIPVCIPVGCFVRREHSEGTDIKRGVGIFILFNFFYRWYGSMQNSVLRHLLFYIEHLKALYCKANIIAEKQRKGNFYLS